MEYDYRKYVLAYSRIKKAVAAEGLVGDLARAEVKRRGKAWRDEHMPNRGKVGRPRSGDGKHEERREYFRAYYRDELKRRPVEDVSYRLSLRVRARVLAAIKRGRATKSFERWMGYSIPDLRAHLERQFLYGMTWENHGRWHVDHIVPLSKFTIAGYDDPEFRRAWALANLRPVWGKTNRQKKDRRTHLL